MAVGARLTMDRQARCGSGASRRSFDVLPGVGRGPTVRHRRRVPGSRPRDHGPSGVDVGRPVASPTWGGTVVGGRHPRVGARPGDRGGGLDGDLEQRRCASLLRAHGVHAARYGSTVPARSRPPRARDAASERAVWRKTGGMPWHCAVRLSRRWRTWRSTAAYARRACEGAFTDHGLRAGQPVPAGLQLTHLTRRGCSMRLREGGDEPRPAQASWYSH